MRLPVPLLVPSLLVLSTLTSPSSAAETAATPGSIAHGKTIFQQMCALCHTTTPDGVSGQGPNLVGLLGRPAASLPNFGYSKALSDSGITWDQAKLDRFLTNPTAMVPGTNMVIMIPNAQDRQDVIAYLSTLSRQPSSASRQDKKPEQSAAAAALGVQSDWMHDAPGVKHHVTVESLPAPFATASAGNSPKVVAKPADAKLAVPAGFSVKPFVTDLSGPRIVHVAPNGDIFIAETKANRIHIVRTSDGADKPSVNQIFLSGLDRPFGMAFYPAGNNPQWLYIANNNNVVRVPYHSGDLKAQDKPEIIVPKLADTQGGHSSRDIAFSKDGKQLFISVGSESNVAENIAKKSPEEVRSWEAEHGFGSSWGAEANRADILFTDPEGHAPLRPFATGIRNGVGIAVDQDSGDLWTATNERDGLGDNLVPDYITRVKEGAYYGWPWYYLGNHEDPRHAGERPDLAGEATVPDVLIQAHSASLGFAFYTATSGPSVFPSEYRGDIFAALHGSWNRQTRTGYKIVQVKRENGVPTGEYIDFMTGFVVDNKSVWGRPVGVAVAHDGALLVSDDASDTLWRVSYQSKESK